MQCPEETLCHPQVAVDLPTSCRRRVSQHGKDKLTEATLVRDTGFTSPVKKCGLRNVLMEVKKLFRFISSSCVFKEENVERIKQISVEFVAKY